MADEYIRREDAFNGVSIEAERMKAYGTPVEFLAGMAHAALFVKSTKKVPAADVAPVVRCKDCIYWHRYLDDHSDGAGECDKLTERDKEEFASFDAETAFNDYCSCGKRKE